MPRPISPLGRPPTRVSLKRARTLLKQYGSILAELQARGIVRSSNNPISDYAEVLVCKALRLTRQSASTKGYDATDRQGRRYEIKGRRPTAANRSLRLSAIRDIPGGHFAFLVVVLFAEDFSVRRAVVVPASAVRAAARYRNHVNAWILDARESLFGVAGCRDVTKLVSGAAR
jgi:hypothetical protein